MSIKIKDIFGEWVELEKEAKTLNLAIDGNGALKDNPMLAFGEYGNGVRCKFCVNLIKCGRRGKKWYKCKLRCNGNGGVKTDHRVNWLACYKYQEKEQFIF